MGRDGKWTPDMTEDQARQLAAFRNINSPKKNDILSPDDLKNLEGKYDPKEYRDNDKDIGRIITLEDLQKEDAEKDITQAYKETFLSQLNEFSHSDENEYDHLDIEHSDILVKVFCMDVSMFPTLKSEKQVFSKLYKRWVVEENQELTNAKPIVKVLKIGDSVNSTKYSVGDLAFVPANEVVGSSWNPEFLQMQQYQKSAGMEPKIPDGMRQKLLNVEKNWGRYSVKNPWELEGNGKANTVYLLSESNLRGKFLLENVK